MYDVTVKTGFSAAHQLRLYDGKYENLHGHNWTAQVTVEADELNPIGVGIDFVELKDCLLYTSPSPRDGLLSRMPSSA